MPDAFMSIIQRLNNCEHEYNSNIDPQESS